MAVVLSSANVVGYTKCSKQASGQLRDMARNAMTSGLTVSSTCVTLGVSAAAGTCLNVCLMCRRQSLGCDAICKKFGVLKVAKLQMIQTAVISVHDQAAIFNACLQACVNTAGLSCKGQQHLCSSKVCTLQ